MVTEGVQMNSHMPFNFITCLVPWLKEYILISLHKHVSTRLTYNVDSEP
jgi:hypothetical protein